ncbi:bifunctional DNA primase/polymerase [Sphingomonas sp.]|uniref:bifunctional DNA primase/polymerase n=1 Tax=Sphingomonas sp. TaxID=28214 RepID=UPI00257DA51E|nr:bifunctional DNA primase/polymerase [Sphingomonas sp.]
MLQHALAWASRGFRVFPISPGKKTPAIKKWELRATSDPEVIERVWTHAEYNVGVLCDDMIVVDVDVKKGKRGVQSFFELGLPPDTLTVETPTGGFHAYYKGPSRANKAELANGIDVRSFHGYVIAPGSVTTDGVYRLAKDVPLLDVPVDFLALCDAPRVRRERATEVELDKPASIESAKLWLSMQEPAIEGSGGDAHTFKTACGVRDFGVSEETAYDLLLDWNDTCSPPWEPDQLRVKVENAYDYGQNAVGVLAPEVEFGGLDVPLPVYKERPSSPWMWAGDEGIELNQQWLYYNRIPQSSVVILVGPSGGGKTFFALEMAKSAATGSEFFGMEPDERCGAVVLSAEGLGGLKARVKSLPANIPVAMTSVSGLHDPKRVADLTEALDEKNREFKLRFGVPLGLIVLDTLTASALLADENDNSECGRAMVALGQWAQRYNCAVVVTHHPPKSSTGPRGGSALYAGADVVIEIDKPFKASPIREVHCTKNRDAQTGQWGSFTLIPRAIGMDDRLREITTMELSMSASRPPRFIDPESKLRPPNGFDLVELAINDVRKEVGLDPDDPVPLDAVKESFARLAPDVKRTTRVMQVKRCLEWGLEAGCLFTIVKDGETYVSDTQVLVPE